jgi:hypothetical protein
VEDLLIFIIFRRRSIYYVLRHEELEEAHDLMVLYCCQEHWELNIQGGAKTPTYKNLRRTGANSRQNCRCRDTHFSHHIRGRLFFRNDTGHLILVVANADRACQSLVRYHHRTTRHNLTGHDDWQSRDQVPEYRKCTKRWEASLAALIEAKPLEI